jgi:hypothetical protein
MEYDMAEILTHTFVSAKAESPDPSLVSAHEWNDGHTFAGGSNGQVLSFDSTKGKSITWIDGVRTLTGANSTISGTSPQTYTLTTGTFNTGVALMLNLAVILGTANNQASSVELLINGNVFMNQSANHNTFYTYPSAFTLLTGTYTFAVRVTSAGTSFVFGVVNLQAIAIGRG